MTAYRTPGVYVREVQMIPPAVAAVATAIPCFFGYTEDATLAGTPTRITSLLEFEEKFEGSPVTTIDLDVVKRVTESGALLGVDVTLNQIAVGGTPVTTSVPTELLHYCVRHFYACGGGPCWIYSLGAHGSNTASDYTDAITALEAIDEPTLLVFPGATGLATHAAVIQHALSSALRTQDRFVIADVREAYPTGENADSNAVDTAGTGFRSAVAPVDSKALQYGAAYWPYLNTQIPWYSTEDDIRIVNFTRREIQNDGSPPQETTPLSGLPVAISDAAVRDGETSAYNACKTFAQNRFVTLPPSGAVAGVYATIDRNRGVWKAPANVGLALVSSAAIRATNDDNDRLNVDTTSGKSINVIRAFTGRGVLVWGARTLAGNDNEYRYVNVRRLTIMIEESVQKAIGTFVFESNDKNTWVKVKTMIENFLFLQWRAGALQGAKPEDAYHVLVGLGTTMTPDDILNGLMRVSVFIAPVRPAEFIELTFMQKLPNS